MPFQFFQFPNAVHDVSNVLFEQCVDFAAFFVRRIAELEQGADFTERHVERAAVADEPQPLSVLPPV